MLEKSAAISIAGILRDLTPEFEAPDGKAFYGKLNLPLAFYHYVGGPAQAAAIDGSEVFGSNLSKYIELIKSYNGCILYDKTFSLCSFGMEFTRSLNLEDQSLFRIEDENPVFFALNKEERLGRDIKVGALFLRNDYSIYVSPRGECFLRAGKAPVLHFANLDAAVSNIIDALDHVLTFPHSPDEKAEREIEEILIQSAGATSS
ncbi:hypothetical protein GCM10009087_04990 [Sphingomonas oligophenolica]|uniref:SMI1/KNR4 family protein n=1 Tax=Sphingomonas oligophenolica TaxID=301154 RepID=A0ABU9YCB9_9SPHN